MSAPVTQAALDAAKVAIEPWEHDYSNKLTLDEVVARFGMEQREAGAKAMQEAAAQECLRNGADPGLSNFAYGVRFASGNIEKAIRAIDTAALARETSND